MQLYDVKEIILEQKKIRFRVYQCNLIIPCNLSHIILSASLPQTQWKQEQEYGSYRLMSYFSQSTIIRTPLCSLPLPLPLPLSIKVIHP